MAKRSWKYLRKFAILLTGVPVIIIGIILIPLPGPGLLVVLLGMIILAVEFEWAQRHVHTVRHHATKAAKKAQEVATRKKPTSDKTSETRPKN